MKKFIISGILFAMIIWGTGLLIADDSQPIAIGSQRQLFLDDQWLISEMKNVEIRVHQPVRRELSDIRNRPWEGSGGKFHSVLFDPSLKKYRMYYTATAAENVHPWDVKQMHVAFLESDDGIHWPYRPLNLIQWNGSKDNNLIMKNVLCFSPFLDENPKTLNSERYKGISSDGYGKMTVWTSADGIKWTPKNNGEPVYIPKTPNAFDSQNVAFWSKKEEKYIVYYRAADPRGFRSAERATSSDFIHWTKEKLINVPQNELPRTNHGEFYTNQIIPYYRAPQIYLGFPARYNDFGVTESFKLLPEQDERAIRMKSNKRFGTVTSDSIFISSRDGINFRLSNDVFLAPGLKNKFNWSYGDNYIAHGIVETLSPEEDEGKELSFYACESSFTGNDTRCRRYSLRLDGFASLHAGTKSGLVVTKPLTFTGRELSLNIGTSGYGSARIEICSVNGKPFPGFTKEDCDMIYGDSLDRRVSWKGSKDVSSLAGSPVILKFYLCEADLYSLVFEK